MALLDEARDKLRVGTRQILQLVTQPPLSDTGATLRRARSNLEELLGEFRRAAVVTQTAAATAALQHTTTLADQSTPQQSMAAQSLRSPRQKMTTPTLPAIVNKSTPPPSATALQPGSQKKAPPRSKNASAVSKAAMIGSAAALDEPRMDDMAVHPLPFIHTTLNAGVTTAAPTTKTKSKNAARKTTVTKEATRRETPRNAPFTVATTLDTAALPPATAPSATSVPLLTAMIVYVEECQAQAALLLESQQALDTAELLLTTAEAEMTPLRVIAERLVCPQLQSMPWMHLSNVVADMNGNVNEEMTLTQDHSARRGGEGDGSTCDSSATHALRAGKSKFGKLLTQHSAEAKAAPRRVVCGFVPDEAELPLALRAFLRVVQQAMLRLVCGFYRGLAADPQADDAATLFRTTLTCLDRLVQLLQCIVTTPTFLIEPVPVSCLKPSRTASQVPPSPAGQTVSTVPQWQPVNISMSTESVVAGLSVTALCAVPQTALTRERNTRNKKKNKQSSSSLPGPRLYRVPDLAYHVVFSGTVYIYDMCHALLKCVHSRYGAMPLLAAEATNNAVAIEPSEESTNVFAVRNAEPPGPGAVYRHCIRALGVCLNVCEGSVKSFLVLATIKYLPWRLQLYELMAQCYEETQSYVEAWQVAQRAEQKLRELVELECYAPTAVPASRQRVLLQAAQRLTLMKLKYGWYQAITLRMQQQQQLQQQQRARSTTFTSGNEGHGESSGATGGPDVEGNATSANTASAAHYTTTTNTTTAADNVDGGTSTTTTGIMAEMLTVDLPRSGKELLQKMLQQLYRAQQPMAQALAQVGSRSTLANDPTAGLAARPVTLTQQTTLGEKSSSSNTRPGSAGAVAEAALRERLARESCALWLPFLVALLTPHMTSGTGGQDGMAEGRTASLLQTGASTAAAGGNNTLVGGGGTSQRTRLGGTTSGVEGSEAYNLQHSLAHHHCTFAGLRSCALEALQWCFQRLGTAYVADKACRKALVKDASLYPFTSSVTTTELEEEEDKEEEKKQDNEVTGHTEGQDGHRQGSGLTRTTSRKASRPSSQGKSTTTNPSGAVAATNRSRSVTTRQNAAGNATRVGSARRGGTNAASAQAASAAVSEEALLTRLLNLRYICPYVWALLTQGTASSDASGVVPKAHVVLDTDVKEDNIVLEEEDDDMMNAEQANRVRLPRSRTERAQAELLLLVQAYYQLYNATSSVQYVSVGAMLRHVVRRLQIVMPPSLHVLLELVATTVKLLQQLRYTHVLQRFLALVLSSGTLPSLQAQPILREAGQAESILTNTTSKHSLSSEEMYLVQATATPADLQSCLHHSQWNITSGSNNAGEEKGAVVQGNSNNEMTDKGAATAGMTAMTLLTMYNETRAMSRFMLALLAAARTLQQMQTLLDQPTSTSVPAVAVQAQTRRASSLQVSLSRLVIAPSSTTMYSTTNNDTQATNSNNTSNATSGGWRELPWAYAALYERLLYHVSFYLVHHAALWPELKSRLTFTPPTKALPGDSVEAEKKEKDTAKEKTSSEEVVAETNTKESTTPTTAITALTSDAAEQAYLHVMTYAMAGLQRSGRAPVHLVSGIATQLAEHVLHDLQSCLAQAATETRTRSTLNRSLDQQQQDGTWPTGMQSWQTMRLVAERGMLANSLVSVALRLVVQRQAALRHILQRPTQVLQGSAESKAMEHNNNNGGETGKATRAQSREQSRPRRPHSGGNSNSRRGDQREDTEAAVVYRRAAQLCDTRTALTRTAVLLRHHVAQVRQLLQQHAQRREDLRILTARQASTRIYGLATAKEVRLLRTLQAEEALQPDDDDEDTNTNVSRKAGAEEDVFALLSLEITAGTTAAADEEARLLNWSYKHPLLRVLVLLCLAQAGSTIPTTSEVDSTTAAGRTQRERLQEAVRLLQKADTLASEENEAMTSQKRPSSPPNNTHRMKSGRGVVAALRCLERQYSPVMLWSYAASTCALLRLRACAAIPRDTLDSHFTEKSMTDSRASEGHTRYLLHELILRPKIPSLQDSSVERLLTVCRAMLDLAGLELNSATTNNSSNSTASEGDDTRRVRLGRYGRQRVGLACAYRALFVMHTLQHLKQKLMSGGGSDDAAVMMMLSGSGATSGGAGRPASAVSSLVLQCAAQMLNSLLPVLYEAQASLCIYAIQPLMAICYALLTTSSQSPMWHDAGLQLLAVRTVHYLRQTLLRLAVMQPVPQRTDAGIALYTAVQRQVPALYRLLFATFVHVWNAVYCHPCDRQIQYKAYVSARSTYSRRVLGQRLQGGGNAGEANDAAQSQQPAGAAGHERTHARNRAGAAGAAGRAAAGNKAHVTETNSNAAADPMAQTAVGVAGGIASTESSADFFGAAYVADSSEAPAQNASCALYDAMPVEYLELFEQLLFLTPHGVHILLRPGTTNNSTSVSGASKRGDGTTAAATTPAGASSGHHPSMTATMRTTSSAIASRVGGSGVASSASFLPLNSAEGDVRPQSPSQCVESSEDMWLCVERVLAEVTLRGVPQVLHDVAAALALAEHSSSSSGGGGAASPTGSADNNNNSHSMSAHAGAAVTNTGSHVAASIAALEQLIRQPRCQEDPLFAKIAVRVVEYCVYYSDHAAAQRIATCALEVMQKQGVAWQSYVTTLMQQLRSWCTRNGFTVEDFAVGSNNNNVGGASVTGLSSDGAEQTNEPNETATKEDDTRRRGPKERSNKTNTSANIAAESGHNNNVNAAQQQDESNSGSAAGQSYTTVERSWTRLEQYTLRQLTRAMAWYRRRRALRWLHARQVQFTKGAQAMLELQLACAARHEWAAWQRARNASLNGGNNTTTTATTMTSGEDALVRPSSAPGTTATTAVALHGRSNSRSTSPSPATTAQSRAGRRTVDTPNLAVPSMSGVDEQTLSAALVQHAARAATLFNVCQLPGWAVRAVQTALEPLREHLGPGLPDIFYYTRDAEEMFAVMQQQQAMSVDECISAGQKAEPSQYATMNTHSEPAGRPGRANSNAMSSSSISDGGMTAMQMATEALPDETIVQLKALQPGLVQLTRELLVALALVRDDYCSAQHGIELALQPGAVKVMEFVQQAGQLRFAGHVPSLQVRLSRLGQAEQRRYEQRQVAQRMRTSRFVRWQLQQCRALETETRARAEADARAALYALVCTAAEELPALRPWQSQLRPRNSTKVTAEMDGMPQGNNNTNATSNNAMPRAGQSMAASMRTNDTATRQAHGPQANHTGPHQSKVVRTNNITTTRVTDATVHPDLAALYSLNHALYVPSRPSRVKAVAAVREGRNGLRSTTNSNGHSSATQDGNISTGGAMLMTSDCSNMDEDCVEGSLLHISADTSETSVIEGLLYLLRCLQYTAVPRLCLRLCLAAHRVTGGKYGLELLPLALGLRAVQSNAEYAHLRHLCIACCRATGRQQRLLSAARRRWERYTLTLRYAEVCDTSPLYGARALLHRLLTRTTTTQQNVVRADVKENNTMNAMPLVSASTPPPPVVFEGGPEELRATLQAYQSAVTYLKAKRRFVSLGLCLLELGHIRLRHNAIDEAERCWLDAVDALTEVPACLRVWRGFASSSSSERTSARNAITCDVQNLGLARVLYCTTALGSLAMYVYNSHQRQAVEACLLAATLLAQYLQCNAVSVNMPVCCIDVMDGLFADLETSELAAYLSGQNMTTTHTDSDSMTSATAEEARAWCGHAGNVVHTLLYMSQQLLEYDYGAYAGLLAALAEAIAHRRTASVSLVVEARLLRAKAAMRVGDVSAALQLIVTVCQGAQLPCAAYHLIQPASLPPLALVHLAGRMMSSASTSQDKRSNKAQQQQSPSQQSPQAQYPSGGNDAAGRVTSGEYVGTLQYDNAALPTSERNVAALQAFVQDCFPALYTRVNSGGHAGTSAPTASSTNNHVSTTMAVGGLHEAVVAFYGERLARRVVLSAAQILVELGSCDAAYLWLTAYTPTTPYSSGAVTRLMCEANGQASDLLANFLAGGGGAVSSSSAGNVTTRSRPGSRDVSVTRGRSEGDSARRANAGASGNINNSNSMLSGVGSPTGGVGSGKDNTTTSSNTAKTVCSEALRVAELLLHDLAGDGDDEEGTTATGNATKGTAGNAASGSHKNTKAARSANTTSSTTNSSSTGNMSVRRKKELNGRAADDKSSTGTTTGMTPDPSATVAALESWIEAEANAALAHRVTLCRAWLATAQGNSRAALALLEAEVKAYTGTEAKGVATTNTTTLSESKAQSSKVTTTSMGNVAQSSTTSESAMIAAAAIQSTTTSNVALQSGVGMSVGKGFHVSLVPEVPSFFISVSHTYWCAVQQCRVVNHLRQREFAAASAVVQQAIQLCTWCEDSYHARRFRLYEAAVVCLQGRASTSTTRQAVRDVLAELRSLTQEVHPGPADPYDAWVAFALAELTVNKDSHTAITPYAVFSQGNSNNNNNMSTTETEVHESALREVIAMLVAHAGFHGYTTSTSAQVTSAESLLQMSSTTLSETTQRVVNSVPRSIAWGGAMAGRLHAALNAFAQHKFISCPVVISTTTTSGAEGAELKLRMRWQEGMSAIHYALVHVAPLYDTQAHPTCLTESKLLLARALLRLPRTHVAPSSASRRAKSGPSQGLLPLWCAALAERTSTHDSQSSSSAAAWLPSLLQPITASNSSVAWSERAKAAVDTLPFSSERCAATLLLQVLEMCVMDGTHDYGSLRLALLELAALFARAAQGSNKNTKEGAVNDEEEEQSSTRRVDKAASIARLQATVAASCTTLALLVSDMAHNVLSNANAFAEYAEDETTLTTPNQLRQRNHLPECLLRALHMISRATGYLTVAMQPAHRHSAPSVSAFYEDTEGAAGQGGVGAGRQRSLSSAGSAAGTRDGPRRSSGRPSSPPSQQSSSSLAAMNNTSGNTAGQVVTLQEMAHCYGVVHGEQRKAYDMLLPPHDALTQELMLKLLKHYLQDMTVPPSCTYLCYSAEQRKRQRWQLGGPQALRTAMTTLLASHAAGGNMIGGWMAGGLGLTSGGGGTAATRRGGNATSGAAGGNTSGTAAASAGAQATQQMQDTVDIWNATLPPLMLATLPTQLCGTGGMDELAAPKVNTVLAQSFVSASSAPLLWSTTTTPMIESKSKGNMTSTRHGTRRTASTSPTTTAAIFDSEAAALRVTLLAAIAPQNDVTLNAPPALSTVAERNRQLRQRILVQNQQQLALMQQQQQAAQLPPSSSSAAGAHRGAGGSAAMDGAAVAATSAKRRPSSRSPSSNGSPMGRTGHRLTGGSFNAAQLATVPLRRIPPISINAALQEQQIINVAQDTRTATNAARSAEVQHVEEEDDDAPWTCLCVTLPLSTVQSLRQQAEKLKVYLQHCEDSAEEKSAQAAGGNNNNTNNTTTMSTPKNTHGHGKNSTKPHDNSAHALFGNNLRGTNGSSPSTLPAPTTSSSARHTSVEAAGSNNSTNNNSGSTSAGMMTLHGAANAVLATTALSPSTRLRGGSVGYGGQQLALALAEATAALQNRGQSANIVNAGGNAPGSSPQQQQQQGMLTSASLAAMNYGGASGSSNNNNMNAATTLRARSAMGNAAGLAMNNGSGNGGGGMTSGGSGHHGGLNSNPTASSMNTMRLNSTASGLSASGMSNTGRNGANMASSNTLVQGRANGVDMSYRLRNRWMLEETTMPSGGGMDEQAWSREMDEAKATFVMHFVEAIVRASATSAVLSSEARVEACISTLLPRCHVTEAMVGFFVNWLSEEKGGASRFFDPGLHEWLQRIQRFVAAPETHEGSEM